MSALLSATSLKDFRACPMRFRLRYVEKLRPIEVSEHLRIGTNWGELHGVYNAEGPDAIVVHLDKRYATIPGSVDPEKWEVEKMTLLTCLMGYYEYWKNDPITVQATEQELAFQVGRHRLFGKMDHIGLWQGRKALVERKSTSKSLEAGSDYWEVWQRDLQISLYYLTVPADTAILLDVWRKPTIKQKQTETPQDYAERLAGDIAERPEHYFARRELTRTERERRLFLANLQAMERYINYAEKANVWFENESACNDPYACDYRRICHGPGAGSVCDGKAVPDGFTRLTVRGR